FGIGFSPVGRPVRSWRKAGHRSGGPDSGCRKRSTPHAPRCTLNGLLLSWTLDVGRWTLGVSPFVHEMAFRPTFGTGDLRRGRLVRLEQLRARRNRSEKV